MSIPPHTPDWANQSSFTATLYSFQGGLVIPVTHISKIYLQTFTTALKESANDTGWLMARGDRKAMALHFSYHSSTSDRLHFMLALDTNRERKLGISRNGYLGLYQHASVSDFWTLEPLDWQANELRCRLRDHQGNLVKVEPNSPHYLHVGEGNAHDFLLVRQA